MTALMSEWLVTPSLNSRQRRQLEELGVTREAVERGGGLGWARVATTGRLYMPSNAGDVAIIQPVWVGSAPSIYQAVETPLLADLLAWLLGNCHGSVLLEVCEAHWRAEDKAEEGARTAVWWGGEAA